MSDASGRSAWSLSSRLAWRLAGVMLAAVVLAGTAVAWRTITIVYELDDTALQDQARAVAAHLTAGPGGVARVVLPPALDAAFRYSDGDNLFVVADPSGRALAASDGAAAAAMVAFLPPAPGFFRVPASPAHRQGMVGLLLIAGRLRIAVAQGREQRQVLVDSLVQEFLESSLWLLLPIGLLTVGIAVLTLRRGLAPLRHASAAAALVGPARAGVRLPTAGLPTELRPLVDTVNQALRRLEAGLGAQRRFVGEAAHALRTPLAVLTARLDNLADTPEVLELRSDVDRMGRLVGQMLGIARLDGLPLDVSHAIDLHAVAVEAISALAPLAIRDGIELVLTERGAAPGIRGNHAGLVLALTNLIENALGHAPAGTAVEVRLGPSASLAVLDRGPGVAAGEREHIFRRFHRGRADPRAGAGLGLAIVAEIAAAHAGSVRMQPRSGGGAIFILTLGGGGVTHGDVLAPGDHGGDEKQETMPEALLLTARWPA